MKLIIEKNPEARLNPEQIKNGLGRGFIYHASHQPLIKLKILVRNIETEPEIYVNKIEKKVYKIHQLISFLSHAEMSQKGTIMLHGAGVSDQNGQGILFGARQDIGKTTLVLNLARRGFSIIGDDALNLKKDGSLIRIQKKAGIYPHPENLKNLSLSLKEQLIGWGKYHFFVNPPFCHLIYPNLRVDYSKIGRVADKVGLKRIFILDYGKNEINKIGKEEAINKFLSTTFDLILPEGFARRLIYNYCFANNISPTFVEDNYRRIIEQAFDGKETILIKGKNYLEIQKLFLKFYAER